MGQLASVLLGQPNTFLALVYLIRSERVVGDAKVRANELVHVRLRRLPRLNKAREIKEATSDNIRSSVHIAVGVNKLFVYLVGCVEAVWWQ